MLQRDKIFFGWYNNEPLEDPSEVFKRLSDKFDDVNLFRDHMYTIDKKFHIYSIEKTFNKYFIHGNLLSGLNKFIEELEYEKKCNPLSLNGQFTIVYWESQSNDICFVTDRLGLAPLYYIANEKCFLWSSEIKYLTGLGDVQFSLNQDAITNFLNRGYFVGNETMFNEVNIMPPGSIVRYNLNSNKLSFSFYWELRTEEKSDFPAMDTPDVMYDVFQSAFDALDIKNDQKVLIPLSGGLDSRLILGEANARNLNVSAITYGHGKNKEMQIAESVAEKIKTPHLKIFIDNENWLYGRMEAIWILDGSLDIGSLHCSCLNEEIYNYDVILDGFIGDVIMGGSYFKRTDGDISYLLYNRARRYINGGPLYLNSKVKTLLPFVDNSMLDMFKSLIYWNENIEESYYKMLLIRYPQPFQNIESTTNIRNDFISNLNNHVSELKKIVTWQGIKFLNKFNYNLKSPYHPIDYLKLCRDKNTLRFFQELLSSYIPEHVNEERWLSLKLSNYHDLENLLRRVTISTYLVMLFDNSERKRLLNLKYPYL